MFYKVVGYSVWTGAKWYLGRKVGTGSKVAGAVAAATAAGAAAYLLSHGDEHDLTK